MLVQAITLIQPGGVSQAIRCDPLIQPYFKSRGI